MLSLEEAQARLLDGVVPLATETVPLLDADGRRLAEDVVATRTQPPFDASAMDGYAIRFADLPGPWTVIGESAAGHGFPGAIATKEAVRIFTGAALPDGADTIVVQEDTRRDGGALMLIGEGPPNRGTHIRKAGIDFAVGDRLASSGTCVTPALIGLLASGGHANLPVRRRPRIVLLATGNELVPPGVEPGAGQIVSSNGVMLAALLARAGADVIDAGIIRDDRQTIEAAIASASGADVLVTIGGASVGDHDLVLPALRGVGATIDFWKVAIKPGKPMLAGALGDTRVIGLPGNPVSAFVCATLFLIPLVRRLGGADDPLPHSIDALLTRPLSANGSRRDHLRARLDRVDDHWCVTPANNQDSSMLSTLTASNALIVRPPDAPAVTPGERVPVLPLDKLWIEP